MDIVRRWGPWGLAVALALGLSLQAAMGSAQRGPRTGQAAPEITGGPWINSEALSLRQLRGRVVLVEFWTYG
jgi:hypothetical protein